jgi:hypothetical protein
MMRWDSDGYEYDYDLFDMEYFAKMGEFLMAMIVEEDEKGQYYLIGLNLSKLTKL